MDTSSHKTRLRLGRLRHSIRIEALDEFALVLVKRKPSQRIATQLLADLSLFFDTTQLNTASIRGQAFSIPAPPSSSALREGIDGLAAAGWTVIRTPISVYHR